MILLIINHPIYVDIFMNVTYENSLKYKVLQRIEQLPSTVVLRSDLSDLSGSRQIGSILQQLIKEEKIIRLGYGVYAKLSRSERFKSSYLSGGFNRVAKEALTRLKVNWKPSRAEEEYNSGKSTQIPVNTVFRIKDRFNRKLSYNGAVLKRDIRT